MKKIQTMLDFIYKSPTAFQAIDNIKMVLLEKGFQELNEGLEFSLEKGGKYFVTRNGTSMIAFDIGSEVKDYNFNIVASHSDAPTFKVKPNAVIVQDNFIKLNTEMYGGAIANTWLDRPLSLAGRVIVKEEDGIDTRLLHIKKPMCVIPNVAIHQNRNVNENMSYNNQVDMLPVITSGKEFDFKAFLANEVGVETNQVISFDLFLYPCVEGYTWGLQEEYFSSYHIDNLECAYTSLVSFLSVENKYNINVYVTFDNEEVGSLTRQGADSAFLKDTLKRIADGLQFDVYQALASSIMVSADNAHAVHPAHPEKADPTNRPLLNEGVVIKYNANQSYTTDAISAALLLQCARKANVKTQYFTNRSDTRGGSTLGNISAGHVSIASVDIGLAQLAMHSAMETAGTKDFESMIRLLEAFYQTRFKFKKEGKYQVL